MRYKQVFYSRSCGDCEMEKKKVKGILCKLFLMETIKIYNSIFIISGMPELSDKAKVIRQESNQNQDQNSILKTIKTMPNGHVHICNFNNDRQFSEFLEDEKYMKIVPRKERSLKLDLLG